MTLSQRDLLHAAPDPTVIVDESGRIVFASSRVEPVFGYAPDELVGEPVEVLVPERHRRAHQSHRSTYIEAPKARPMGVALSLYGRRKDGTEFPVEISLSPVDTEQGGWSRVPSATSRNANARKTCWPGNAHYLTA